MPGRRPSTYATTKCLRVQAVSRHIDANGREYGPSDPHPGQWRLRPAKLFGPDALQNRLEENDHTGTSAELSLILRSLLWLRDDAVRGSGSGRDLGRGRLWVFGYASRESRFSVLTRASLCYIRACFESTHCCAGVVELQLHSKRSRERSGCRRECAVTERLGDLNA